MESKSAADMSMEFDKRPPAQTKVHENTSSQLF